MGGRQQKYAAMQSVSCSDLHPFNCKTELTVPCENTGFLEVSHNKYFCLNKVIFDNRKVIKFQNRVTP